MQVNVTPPDQGALTTTAQKFLDTAKELVIDSPAMYEVAAEDLQAVKKKAKDLEEQRTKLVAPLNQVVKDINAMFKPPAEFLAQAESTLKSSMLTYSQEQERLRREEEARQRAAAEAAAARERARLEQEAAATRERARLEQERLEQERLEAIAAGNTVKAETIAAKSEGVAAQAEAKLDGIAEVAACVQVAPVVATIAEAPKVSGISTRGVWKATVTDMAAFLAHVAANPDLVGLVKVNETALNQMAKALKANLNIPGVKPEEERVMSARAA